MSFRAGDPAGNEAPTRAFTEVSGPAGPDSAESHRILAELQQKLESMPLIEQAKGILMARFALDAERAFKLLVRWSQANNVKLRTISDSLVGAADDPAALGRTIEAFQQRSPAPGATKRQSRTSRHGSVQP